MIDLKEKYEDIVEKIKKSIPFQPEISIVLGSGLGDFIKNIEIIKSISTSEIKNYPRPTIESHRGYLHFAKCFGKKLLIIEGRIHFYEGYKIIECVLPIYIAFNIGCKKLILTNAAGGVNPNFNPGDLMLANSFCGINIKKELSELFRTTPRYYKNDFWNFPSIEINTAAKKAASTENILLREGVYWYTKGPIYETPAEVKMIQKYGGDAVGMSTVHEALYANFLGIKTSSISCITNAAAGLSINKLSHNEVIETAEKVKNDFERLVKKTIEFL